MCIIISGFGAYLGMLTVDLYHNHPVMKAFIEFLQQDVQKNKQSDMMSVSAVRELDTGKPFTKKSNSFEFGFEL